MEIAFTKLSPTQNVTILVESAIPRAEQPGIAAKLLACDSVGGEQVGFIEPASVSGALCRLQISEDRVSACLDHTSNNDGNPYGFVGQIERHDVGAVTVHLCKRGGRRE